MEFKQILVTVFLPAFLATLTPEQLLLTLACVTVGHLLAQKED